MNKGKFSEVKAGVESMVKMTSKVVQAMKRDAARHVENYNREETEDTFTVTAVRQCGWDVNFPNTLDDENYQDISDMLLTVTKYTPLDVTDALPYPRTRRLRFLSTVKATGFPVSPTTWFSWQVGGQQETMHFVWVTSPSDPSHEQNQAGCINDLKKLLPTKYASLVKRNFIKVAGKLAVNPAKARALFTIATNDSSSRSNQAAIDDRIMEFLLHDDPEIIMDLRELNSRPRVYDDFFDIAAQLCDSQVDGIETAVDDRRHSIINHLAMALSASDLYR